MILDALETVLVWIILAMGVGLAFLVLGFLVVLIVRSVRGDNK